MIKVKYPSGRKVKAVAGPCEIKVLHRRFYLFFHTAVLTFIIKRPVLKNNIFPFRDIDHQHLRRNLPLIIKRKTDSITLRKRDPPAADPARRVIDIRHDLAASAVMLVPARIVQLSLDAVQQTADGFTVLPRNKALLLPEVQYPMLS